MTAEINWLLIVVVAIFIVCMVNGYIKGLLRLAVYIIGIVFIIGLVTYISPQVSSRLIENKSNYESIHNKLVELFKEANSKSSNSTIEEQNDTIKNYPLPELMISDLIRNNTKEVYEELKIKLFEDYAAKYLTVFIIKIGSFVILYCLFRILMALLLRATNIISRIPIIRGLNKLLGLFAGFLEALIITWIFFFVLIMFMGNETADKLLLQINSSPFLSFLFNSNILIKCIL
ncbi:MAG: CvpA family protein [Lachnospiraceae bacterium]|nr:CvpA family protein [Lachnospiraceae bacterium]